MVQTGGHDSAVERIRARVEEKAARRAALAQAAEADQTAHHLTPAATHPGDPETRQDTGTADAAPAPLPRHLPSEQELPGVRATTPLQIPAKGWLQIVKRAWAENGADNMPIIGGGVAFFAFLAILPTLTATISLYGLVASPQTVAHQIESLTNNLPQDAARLISGQLSSITGSSGGALTIGLVVSILAALWSASGGVGNLIKAVNIAYDEVETRNFIKLRALSLVLTFGAIVFVLITFGLVAVFPPLIDALPLGVVGTVLAQVVRWVLLLGVMVTALSVLYRVAPDRDAPKFRWVSLGSVVVTLIWAVVSLLFSFYVNNFGSYNKTYGAIAGVIVLMLWLQITVFLVLLGAEINAEVEHQTAQDTTTGNPAPMGSRNATVADELPDPPVPPKGSKVGSTQPE